jgi:hypothetical protein
MAVKKIGRPRLSEADLQKRGTWRRDRHGVGSKSTRGRPQPQGCFAWAASLSGDAKLYGLWALTSYEALDRSAFLEYCIVKAELQPRSGPWFPGKREMNNAQRARLAALYRAVGWRKWED